MKEEAESGYLVIPGASGPVTFALPGGAKGAIDPPSTACPASTQLLLAFLPKHSPSLFPSVQALPNPRVMEGSFSAQLENSIGKVDGA